MATDTLHIESSKRATAQRQMLLELLREADGHLDADELYQRARQKQPSLSLSTVYRSLKLFKELGLVEEHQFDGTRRHYETKPETRHHHLVCLGCGRIIEFKCPMTERLKARIGSEEGFEVTEAEVRLAGYCPDCRQRLLGGRANAESKQETGERRRRMPFGDGTGPRGLGPRTGRGAGYCAGFGRPGFANPLPGRGRFGFGLGWGVPYGYPYPGRYGAGIPYAGYGYPYYGRGYTPFRGYPYGYPARSPVAMWPW